MSADVLSARGLRMEIGSRTILDDVDASVRAGELHALAGPSGAGKSVLLSCLGLLFVPDAGVILVRGEATTGWSRRRRRRFWRDDAAFIYQDYGLIEDESVAYNTALSDITLRHPRPRVLHRLSETLERVGLGGRERDMARVLSGGEKQRCGIARALYKGASNIFADEPTASLDADTAASVIALLREYADAGGAVVVATHDQSLIDDADHVTRL